MVKNIIKRWNARKVIKIAKKYAEEVMKNYNVETIILFGSFVKGTNHEDSDIDVVIDTDDIKENVFTEELNLVKLK